MERNIILLHGKPGSGKSRLGRDLSAHLKPQMSTEHLSIGERVRAIGRGALSTHRREVIDHLNSPHPEAPFSDELAYELVSEYISRSENAELLLLDGYPRFLSQVTSTYELAIKDERELRGMIVTNTSDETAVMRILKRNKKEPDRLENDPESALTRVNQHNAYFPPVQHELLRHGLPIETIDTSHAKQATTHHGLLAVAYMLAQNNETID